METVPDGIESRWASLAADQESQVRKAVAAGQLGYVTLHDTLEILRLNHMRRFGTWIIEQDPPKGTFYKFEAADKAEQAVTLQWRDLEAYEVHDIAYIEDRARTDHDRQLASLPAHNHAKDYFSVQETAEKILHNHDLRASNWLADVAAIKGKGELTPQRFVALPEEEMMILGAFPKWLKGELEELRAINITAKDIEKKAKVGRLALSRLQRGTNKKSGRSGLLNIITTIADTKKLEGTERDEFFARAYASFKTDRQNQDDTEATATMRLHWDAIMADLEAQARPLGKEARKLLRSNHEARLQSSAIDEATLHENALLQRQRALFIHSKKRQIVATNFSEVMETESPATNLSKTEIAVLMGLSPASISMYMSRLRKPSLGNILNMLSVFADEQPEGPLRGDERVKFINSAYDYVTTDHMTQSIAQSSKLHWHDLTTDNVYHIAHLDNYARDVANQRKEKAENILYNHEARANSWFADAAAIYGDWPLQEQYFIDLPEREKVKPIKDQPLTPNSHPRISADEVARQRQIVKDALNEIELMCLRLDEELPADLRHRAKIEKASIQKLPAITTELMTLQRILEARINL